MCSSSLASRSLAASPGGSRRGAVLGAASLAVGAGYGAYALCTSPLEYAAATALWTLGEIFCLPAASGLVAELSPPSQRGRYQGLYGFSLGAGMTLAPVLGSAVMSRFGARALWSACLLTGALVGVGHVAAARRRRRADRERFPPP